MKLGKNGLLIGIVFLLLLSVVFSFYLLSRKDDNFSSKKIEVYDIKEGQVVVSPLVIKGRVFGGNWIGFEGQVGTVDLIGSDGTKLGSAILTAVSDWMQLPIDFQAILVFEAAEDGTASLVFHNENPSGLPERDETMNLPLTVSGAKRKVAIYLGKQSGGDSCTEVFAVEREIKKTEAIARATIEELIKGPTAEEKQAGYFTGIESDTKINKLTIVDGTAGIDFNEALEEGVGGSCRVVGIRQQIIQTLMQFEKVKKVIISINGRTEDILQP